jgi:hypothetical protein
MRGECIQWLKQIFDLKNHRQMGKGLNYKINVMAHAMDPLHMKWIVFFYLLWYIFSHSLLITISNDNRSEEKINGLYKNWKNLQNIDRIQQQTKAFKP